MSKRLTTPWIKLDNFKGNYTLQPKLKVNEDFMLCMIRFTDQTYYRRHGKESNPRVAGGIDKVSLILRHMARTNCLLKYQCTNTRNYRDIRVKVYDFVYLCDSPYNMEVLVHSALGIILRLE